MWCAPYPAAPTDWGNALTDGAPRRSNPYLRSHGTGSCPPSWQIRVPSDSRWRAYHFSSSSIYTSSHIPDPPSDFMYPSFRTIRQAVPVARTTRSIPPITWPPLKRPHRQLFEPARPQFRPGARSEPAASPSQLPSIPPITSLGHRGMSEGPPYAYRDPTDPPSMYTADHIGRSTRGRARLPNVTGGTKKRRSGLGPPNSPGDRPQPSVGSNGHVTRGSKAAPGQFDSACNSCLG